MGSVFKSPPKPKPIIQRVVAPPPPAPRPAPRRIATPEAPRAAAPVQEAGEEVAARARRGRGRASTIIAALEGQLPSVVRKALLGGS